MLKKQFYVIFIVCLMMLFAGCGEHIIVNGNAYRVLTENEEKQMLEFARLTLIGSGDKPGLVMLPRNRKPGTPLPPRPPSLNKRQKNFIRTTMPRIRLSYTGHKSGRASYEWILDDDVMIRLNCEGRFLTDDMRVNTRKVNLKEVPVNGKSGSLEKLTFKEIPY